MSFDTLIRNGTVVFPHKGVRGADIGIRDGLITALLSPGETKELTEQEPEADG